MSDFIEYEELNDSHIETTNEELSLDSFESISLEGIEDISSSDSIQEKAVDAVLDELSLEELYSLKNDFAESDEGSKVLSLFSSRR